MAIKDEVTWLYFLYLLNLLHCRILKYKWKWEFASIHKLIKTGTIWGVRIILGWNSIDVFLWIFALLECYSEFVSSLLITIYQPTLRKFTEKCKPQIHRREKPETSIFFLRVWAKDFSLVLVTERSVQAWTLRFVRGKMEGFMQRGCTLNNEKLYYIQSSNGTGKWTCREFVCFFWHVRALAIHVFNVCSPEKGCGFQSKYAGEIKPIVQSEKNLCM